MGKLGYGLGVGLGGRGAMQAVMSAFLMVPNLQLHSYNGSVALLTSSHLANLGHFTLIKTERD